MRIIELARIAALGMLTVVPAHAADELSDMGPDALLPLAQKEGTVTLG